jgi:hypothetical protein
MVSAYGEKRRRISGPPPKKVVFGLFFSKEAGRCHGKLVLHVIVGE